MSTNRQLWIMGAALVIATAAAVGGYGWWFGHEHNLKTSDNPSDWGPFGDYLGGLLNPLISLFAFYWLGAGVRLQMRQIEDSTEIIQQTSMHQREQAGLALHSQELATINLELSALQSEIDYHQSLLLMWLEQSTPADTAFTKMVLTPEGRQIALVEAIQSANAKIQGRKKHQRSLIEAAKSHRHR